MFLALKEIICDKIVCAGILGKINMVVTSHQSGVHVVAFPFALKGHMGPFMQFSKSLANYGIDVTFVTTSPHLASTQNFFKAHHNVHIACFDMPTEPGEVTPDNFGIMVHHINNLKDAFFELMKALFARDGTSITSCLLFLTLVLLYASSPTCS
jgi:hypothetical protein